MIKKIVIVLAVMLLSAPIYAKDQTETIGDILLMVLPAAAYGTTLYLDDTEGQYQFYRSFGSTVAVTYLLKYSVREKRPESDAKDSFPSGHAAGTFGSASFIHRRYGLKYAIMPYLAAIFTGYSRVHSNKHYTKDVIAGAAIAMTSSWLLVSPYKGLSIRPVVGYDHIGVQVSHSW